MVVWVASREYAGIAEAGGVKNVTCSLCENLVRLGNKVIAFLPLYGCSDLQNVTSFQKNDLMNTEISVHGKLEKVQYATGWSCGVEIVFVCHPSFAEKRAVYTYTAEEERLNNSHVHGTGHEDALFLNTLFQKAVVSFASFCQPDQIPDIVHCQDATTAIIPTFIKYAAETAMTERIVFSHTKCVVTIHNAGPGYHHEFPSAQECIAYTGLPLEAVEKSMNGDRVEPFLLASLNAQLTTVSPQYAKEIADGTTQTAGLSESFKYHHIIIKGITNGIEFSKYDPSDIKKSLLPFVFNPARKDLLGKYHCRRFFLEKFFDDSTADGSPVETYQGIEQFGHLETGSAADPCEPVFLSYHGRIVRQKGIDILAGAASYLLAHDALVRFIFIGQGEQSLENELIDLSRKYPGKCLFLRGYNRSLARLCIAVADFAVFPSTFEPCGLEDFIAQVYGTIPIAHATGGLCKIIDEQTGFLYKENTDAEISEIIQSLVTLKQAEGDLFNNMIAYTASYVRQHYSWRTVVKEKYIPLYTALLGKK